MKLLRILLLLTFLFIGSSQIFAQHIKINKEELSFLKKEQTINVVFSYDNYKRGGKQISESEYVKNRKEKLVLREKDTTLWLDAYQNSKQILWPEAFAENLNKYLSKYKAPKFSPNSGKADANFTMIVHVLWIYSGYDIGIGRSPSKIKLKITIIDNKTNEIKSTINISETRGNNSDDDNDSEWPHLRRVENAFYNSGFKLAIALKRVFK